MASNRIYCIAIVLISVVILKQDACDDINEKSNVFKYVIIRVDIT